MDTIFAKEISFKFFAVLVNMFLAINTGFRIGIIVVIFLLSLFLFSLLNSDQYRNIGQMPLFFDIGFLGITYFLSYLTIIENSCCNRYE